MERREENSSELVRTESPWAGITYGDRTTFGTEPWYTEKNWWKVPESGEANDVRAQFSTLGRLACAATSLRGNKHRLEGSVNQDSYSVVGSTSKEGQKYLVVAVCDGMGSARFSSFAARTAAAACTSLLSRGLRLAGRDMFGILEETHSSLIAEIRKRVFEFRDGEFDAPSFKMSDQLIGELQTTLSFVVVGPTDGNEVGLMAGWIGDSPIYLGQADRWVSISKLPDHDGLHSTASEGLMTSDKLSLHFDTLHDGESVLICTDGVGNFLEHNGVLTSLGQDLRLRWKEPTDRLEFIRDLSFEIQSADDDRTAVLIWHR